MSLVKGAGAVVGGQTRWGVGSLDLPLLANPDMIA
jgi:hypothetical protein